MVIMFTEQEKKYLQLLDKGNYRLSVKPNAPKEVAESIREKISAHKKWLPDTKE